MIYRNDGDVVSFTLLQIATFTPPYPLIIILYLNKPPAAKYSPKRYYYYHTNPILYQCYVPLPARFPTNFKFQVNQPVRKR